MILNSQTNKYDKFFVFGFVYKINFNVLKIESSFIL